MLGSFDGLHKGHQHLLRVGRQIASRSDSKLAVLSFEPHPREFFGRSTAPFRLVNAEGKLDLFSKYGIDIVYALRFDAQIAGMAADDFVNSLLANKLAARHIVVGSDFRFGKARQGDADMLATLGATAHIGVTVVPKVQIDGEDISSSRIRKLIQAGEMETVRELLGHRWPVRFVGERGFEIDEWGRPWAIVQIDSIVAPVQGRFAITIGAYLSDPEELIALPAMAIFNQVDCDLPSRAVVIELMPDYETTSSYVNDRSVQDMKLAVAWFSEPA